MQTGNGPDPMSREDSQLPDKRTVRADLRRARRIRRDTTPPEARATAATQVAHQLRSLPVLRDARCIATYEPLPTEEDVSRLMSVLTSEAGANVRFLVPITLDDLDLSWRDVGTGTDLGRDGIGLADVVVAPALAIGPGGERLGQGGGSYDRALPRRRPDTPVIAVVFPDEVGVPFSSEPHDEPVDAVVTRDGCTTFDRAAVHGKDAGPDEASD